MHVPSPLLRTRTPPATHPSGSCAVRLTTGLGARVHFLRALEVLVHLVPQDFSANKNGMMQNVGIWFHFHTEELTGARCHRHPFERSIAWTITGDTSHASNHGEKCGESYAGWSMYHKLARVNIKLAGQLDKVHAHRFSQQHIARPVWILRDPSPTSRICTSTTGTSTGCSRRVIDHFEAAVLSWHGGCFCSKSLVWTFVVSRRLIIVDWAHWGINVPYDPIHV